MIGSPTPMNPTLDTKNLTSSETAAFFLIRASGLDREAFAGRFDHGNVDAGTACRNGIQDVVERPCHIERRTNPGQGNHALSVGMTQYRPHVSVHIDDTGDDVLSGSVELFLGTRF